MNVSGCNCTPKDCQQTTVAFQQLIQSTKHCFDDSNYPINDVANAILSDTEYLRAVIENLYEQNPQSRHNVVELSFNLTAIENIVKVENKWCHY